MNQTSRDLEERIKRGPKVFNKSFLAGFLICLVIACYLAIYFVGMLQNYIAVPGIIVACIAAVILGFGIVTPKLDPLLEEIETNVIRVVREDGPLTLPQMARKLEYPDAIVMDVVKFLVQDGKLQRNSEGKIYVTGDLQKVQNVTHNDGTGNNEYDYA